MGKLVPIGFTLVILLWACGADVPTAQAPQKADQSGHVMDMGDEGFAFGKPGKLSEVDRIVQISALDSLEFDPEMLEVQVSDTITFVITNDGNNAHEFVLGDESYQQEHATEMSGGEQMGMSVNEIEIEQAKRRA